MTAFRNQTVWAIERSRQVLRHGKSFTSPDADWDWEFDYAYYTDEEAARKGFSTETPTSDTPIIRLYKYTYDKYGQIDEDEMLDEASA